MAAAGWLVTAAAGANSEAGDVSIYTARVNSDQVESATRFDCSDSIYGFIQSEQPRDLRSTAEARWTNPSSRMVKAGERTFASMSTGGQYAWDGIDIEAGSNAFSNMLGAMVDPAAGYEDAIGQWRTDINVGGYVMPSLQIELLC